MYEFKDGTTFDYQLPCSLCEPLSPVSDCRIGTFYCISPPILILRRQLRHYRRPEVQDEKPVTEYTSIVIEDDNRCGKGPRK